MNKYLKKIITYLEIRLTIYATYYSYKDYT